MNIGKIGLVLAVGTLTVFASGGASATTVTVIAGQGFATFGVICPVDSDIIFPVAGTGVDGEWTFAVGDANVDNLGCAIASAEVFQGNTYTQAFGGCLSGILGGILCLGGFNGTGPATVPLDMCQSIAGCVTGSVTLVAVSATA